jgi:hypothetical protein
MPELTGVATPGFLSWQSGIAMSARFDGNPPPGVRDCAATTTGETGRPSR